MADIADVDAPSGGGGGGGGLFSLSGTDWFGVGKTGTAAFVGTERCGSRPNCIAWTKACRNSRDAYNACVEKTTDQDYDLAQKSLNNEGLKNKSAPSIDPKMIIGAIVVLIVLFMVFRKR